MSFFNKILNVFGFGYIEDDDDLEGIVSTPITTPVKDAPKVKDAPNKEMPKRPKFEYTDKPLEASPEMVHRIFDKVIEVTNASMPGYLSQSLNTENQRKYLYDALDESIKQYLSDLEEQAQLNCKAQWQKERDDLKKDMNLLKQKQKELEGKRAEINEQKLSAERQKRALSERVHDLENTILKLEADKEQLEIENRGLINKAKVANVYENDLEEMRKQLAEAKNQPVSAQLTQENAKLKHQVNSLQDKIKQLNEACETSKVKDEMNGAMLNDLQKRASESVQSIKELNQKIDDQNSQMALKDAQIADLKKDLAEKEARIEEDEEAFGELQVIVDHINQFETVKAQLDNRIRSLKAELKEAKNENETLKTTIKNNIYAHAQQEKALKDQIEHLRRLG